MNFKPFGKNRIKRIADVLEKLGITLFGLVAANSVFIPENLKSNDQTLKATLVVSISLIVVSYLLTLEETSSKSSKKQKGKK